MENVKIRNIFGKRDSKESLKGAIAFTIVAIIGIALFICGITLVKDESIQKGLMLTGGISWILFPLASAFAWCDYIQDKRAEKNKK